MLLSLPETHTCKSMILVRMAAILFLCKFRIPTQTKLFNDINLFSLPKHDLKANSKNMINSIDRGIHSDLAILAAILFLCKFMQIRGLRNSTYLWKMLN